jgi:hypothetical protein
LSNDQDINITVKGDRQIALNQDDSGLLNVNINGGQLNIISGMKGTFEGNIIPIACDELGNLKSNITIENIQLSPVTDGIKIFGSSDMIDNIVMKVDADGKLQNHDTELNASVLISNEKLESIEGKLDADNGVLVDIKDAINHVSLKAINADGFGFSLIDLHANGQGILLTTDIDLTAQTTVTHDRLTDVNTSVNTMGNKIDGSVVITNQKLDQTITAINNNVMKASFNGNTRNVACDNDGVLRTNVVVENIALTPQNDGVTIYGSPDGSTSVIIATDEFGKLQTTDIELNSKIETTNEKLEDVNNKLVDTNNFLENMYNKTDVEDNLHEIKLVLDEINVNNSVENAIGNTTSELVEMNALLLTQMDSITSNLSELQAVKAELIESNSFLSLINKNTKSAFDTTTILDGSTGAIFNQNTNFNEFDMGDGADRYTSITFSGSFTVGTTITLDVTLIPKMIMEQSHDGFNWFSDGTECQYNRIVGQSLGFTGVTIPINVFRFIFQKSQISLRYARLKIDKSASFIHLHVSLSK